MFDACEPQQNYQSTSDNCTDIDECEQSPCNRLALCVNLPGSFRCSCDNGTIGDGFELGITNQLSLL